MPVTNIPANKNVGKSLVDINSNFAYLDSENEDRKKDLLNKLNISDVDNALSPTSENPVQNKVLYTAIQNAGSKITVDNALSPTSENPVQNKVIYTAIQNAGSKITVDNILDTTSENPVQNKVIARELINTSRDFNILSARVTAIENGTNPDISADFLTEGGFGNLRYYNGHFQYYDTATKTWVDTSITPNNVYILNMMPLPMQRMLGTYDTDIRKYKLKFEEPADTIIDGQAACIVDKVIIRRKLGSVPVDENDGNLVVEIKRSEFGLYKNNWYVDNALTPVSGDVYYYKAFPMSTTGFCNAATVNETLGLKCKNYTLYGFKLDQNESDPASMITYLPDCDNAQFSSAYMNYTTDIFSYGDWGDAWFIKNLKPCMLKYDGTVDYELDKNDYTKKADGTASDVANTAYGGNAMIGFPKVYWKIVDNGDNTANIYFCDKKIDNDFHCWSHIDNNGNEIDYCYMPIYNGSLINGKLRSISGVTPMVGEVRQTEIDYAKANNLTNDIIWYTEVYSDRQLLDLLVFLVGKSTDTQTVFGAGNNNSYVSASNKGVKNSGTMDNKGLFWGNQDNVSGVKVFGIEHIWGNTWRAIAGWINDKGTYKVKMTYGKNDGSTVEGYNLDGNGYIPINNPTPSGTSEGYVSKALLNNNGLMPIVSSGSASTYFCDGLFWTNMNDTNYALTGGNSSAKLLSGISSTSWQNINTGSDWLVSAGISCKPLATT